MGYIEFARYPLLGAQTGQPTNTSYPQCLRNIGYPANASEVESDVNPASSNHFSSILVGSCKVSLRTVQKYWP
jgi:hypothetical protein